MCIKEINEIISKYTGGETSLEEANAALEALGSDLRIQPGKNKITDAELEETCVGETPAEANGWGLLDTGTGTLDKVEVKAGKLVGGGVGDMYALCLIGGKVYHVEGDALTE